MTLMNSENNLLINKTHFMCSQKLKKFAVRNLKFFILANLIQLRISQNE